ncbi:unnamed protein product [Anisakis simplex]|nr:unnamed protein product [Anisakis simplex]
MKVYHPLGIICLCLNVADFAAPLANIKYVIRKRSSQTLPLPLCIANFLVSNEWFIYGLLKDDFYLILPNGVGSIFATINLVLFIVLPRKTGLRSPILMLFDIILCRRHSSEDGSVADVEAAAVEVTYKELQDSNDRKTWSDRMIANVTGEFENVIAKCTLKEQFGYSDTLNKKLSTDSSVSHIDTMSAGSSSIDAEPAKVCDKNDASLFPENVAIAFDTKQLQQLCGQLSSILHPNQQRRTTEKRQRRQSEYPTEPIASLHRTTSAPNLSHCGQDDN